jgi:Anti-sigma-28 factor, FlgM
VSKEILAQQIARGQYEVDPHAVAEAMLEAGLSAVLVAPQTLDRPPGRVEQDEPGAGPDLA